MDLYNFRDWLHSSVFCCSTLIYALILLSVHPFVTSHCSVVLKLFQFRSCLLKVNPCDMSSIVLGTICPPGRSATGIKASHTNAVTSVSRGFTQDLWSLPVNLCNREKLPLTCLCVFVYVCVCVCQFCLYMCVYVITVDNWHTN